ncbi:MAG: hypothetical protein K0S33_369 [Bacteroidetes bacterium]|jgi:hypothetical protein|nr:hypothetical protein [Bacteroidota bacterium]
MNTFFRILLVCSCPLWIYGQNKAKIESFKKLGRDSLIQLAIQKLNEPGFDPAQYDRITVKANDERLVVEFDLSVQFTGNKSCYYHAVFVNIVGNGSGKSITGNCDQPVFYKRSVSEQKKIDFVFKAINGDNEIGDVPENKLDPGTKMEITEKAGYYYVEISDYSTFSHYKVNKSNGKVYDAGHKHYARSGDEEDKMEIIK